MRFEMATHGTYFATRDRANRLFAKLREAEVRSGTRADRELVLDFSKVTHVSDSFARRFVARVFEEAAEAGRSVSVENACPEVEETIAWARGESSSPRVALLAS
jgi:anti-anti-sigma regulatory factor